LLDFSGLRVNMFVRMLGSAVIAQALLSAGNLCVGLILLRRSTDHAYGAYVLIMNALMLITQLQTQFITPAMVLRMSGAQKHERASLIGRLLQMQRHILPLLGAFAAALTLALWLANLVTLTTACIVGSAILAGLAALHREFFRMVLLAYRLPLDILKADTAYVAILVCGAIFATMTRAPAAATAIVLSLAATAGGVLMSRALWRHEPWSTDGSRTVLREIAAIGAWTTTSCAIYWSFTQGYNYVIVGALDVTAVAAVAAPPLLLMPVNMLSTGVGSLMLPTTSAWLRQHSSSTIFGRLLLLSVGLSCVALSYFGVLWFLRDWIFANILKRAIVERDVLMRLWFVIFILMIFRDQLLFLPLARGRYRILTGLTLVSAVVALIVSYLAILRFGVVGSLEGLIAGEFISVSGLIVLSALEIRRDARTLVHA
jgi:O-antigen/teichoic acid export membrane protein